MNQNDKIAFAVSALLWIAYFANVSIGASGAAPYLTDVQEMLVLFASVTAFIAGVLLREARTSRETQQKAAETAGGSPPPGQSN